MKKKERRPKEMGSQWLNAMCEVLKGGVLAGVVTILVLLICAVLVSVGLVPVEAWAPLRAGFMRSAMWRAGPCWRAWGWEPCCFFCC